MSEPLCVGDTQKVRTVRTLLCKWVDFFGYWLCGTIISDDFGICLRKIRESLQNLFLENAMT
jgi:hypothetical protein